MRENRLQQGSDVQLRQSENHGMLGEPKDRREGVEPREQVS